MTLDDLRYEYHHQEYDRDPYKVYSVTLGIYLDDELYDGYHGFAKFYESGLVSFYLDGYRAKKAFASVRAVVVMDGIKYLAQILKSRKGLVKIEFNKNKPVS